jgi:hypothetical protein
MKNCAIVVDLLLRRETVWYEVNQFRHLTAGVVEVLARRAGTLQQARGYGEPHLSSNDAELVRDIFWDLFRQRFITLGLNDSNDAWPFFRLSHLGGQTLATQSPFRFHDTSSFLNIVSREVPDISAEARVYLDEAVAAYFADCLLACCVMVGGRQRRNSCASWTSPRTVPRLALRLLLSFNPFSFDRRSRHFRSA